MKKHHSKLSSSCLRVSVVIIFLCLTKFTFAAPIYSAPDTTIKQDPSTWDPNDPNCPCHALEKQAEDEFKRMQEAELNNNIVHTSTSDSVVTQQQLYSTATDHSTKHLTSPSQWKHLHRKIRKFRKHLGKKHYAKKQHKFRVADCFHFN